MQLKNMAWSAAVILISTALYAQDGAFVKNEASNRPVSGFVRKQANIAPGQGKKVQGHIANRVASKNAARKFAAAPQKRTPKASKARVRVSKSKSPRNGPVLNTYTNKRGTMVQLKGGAR